MNSIELAWFKLKASLHARVARSREALERAIPNAFTIMVSNAQNGSTIQATAKLSRNPLL